MISMLIVCMLRDFRKEISKFFEGIMNKQLKDYPKEQEKVKI